MTKFTICVVSCGELTKADCLERLKPFLDRVEFQEVIDVTPQIKALNQMLAQVETEYLIPVDADILLNSVAFDRIEAAVREVENDPQWHSILFPLYDTLTERKILALKVLRSRIMKRYPFAESATPDVEHFGRLTKAGFTCIGTHLEEEPIGQHVVKGAHYCYHKYRDVYQTLRSHGYEWDSGVFMGGDTIVEKSKRHFDFFLRKWAATDDDDCLWCIAGMVDGILSPLENRSKTLAKGAFAVKKEDAFGLYYQWYNHKNHMTLTQMLF